ncbi:hypothetical protein [Capnocytophaga catalasegens]|uniref:Transposase n=1 Tax=Capnocytophaga catalasegens TaxID=1004260 RepID=A0AAV5AVQ1_9FLAO|nr:hypothetical protein [Capnocytophaga catalasegens]GIZ15055.1 hypothetical protein RCZ03_10550 [Capnocytophaga catalasegens]GJM49435.1 hypothetical protein RCZ15_04100 [Capnocytophaga catalasegens]GJM52585.1 hypothetical protein RCZ16_09020 [Capnocytophaga catalasegens]
MNPTEKKHLKQIIHRLRVQQLTLQALVRDFAETILYYERRLAALEGKKPKKEKISEQYAEFESKIIAEFEKARHNSK